MEEPGALVRLRLRTPVDAIRENLWCIDPEIVALDPHVGLISNVQAFAIETLEGVHIGSCSVYNYSRYKGQLGILIGDKNYWGKGYGTDTMRLLINHCLTTMGIKHLWVKVLPENVRAQRCYEKSGFVRCGKIVVDGIEFIMMERR